MQASLAVIRSLEIRKKKMLLADRGSWSEKIESENAILRLLLPLIDLNASATGERSLSKIEKDKFFPFLLWSSAFFVLDEGSIRQGKRAKWRKEATGVELLLWWYHPPLSSESTDIHWCGSDHLAQENRTTLVSSIVRGNCFLLSWNCKSTTILLVVWYIQTVLNNSTKKQLLTDRWATAWKGDTAIRSEKDHYRSVAWCFIPLP